MKIESIYNPKVYHVYEYCKKCNHRNDTHDMNCLECCPVKNENIRESEEEFCTCINPSIYLSISRITMCASCDKPYCAKFIGANVMQP